MHTTLQHLDLSRSHAPAWECGGPRANVAGQGRWRVQTAFPRWRVTAIKLRKIVFKNQTF